MSMLIGWVVAFYFAFGPQSVVGTLCTHIPVSSARAILCRLTARVQCSITLLAASSFRWAGATTIIVSLFRLPLKAIRTTTARDNHD